MTVPMTFNRECLGAAKGAAQQAKHHLENLRHDYNEAVEAVEVFRGRMNYGEMERWQDDLGRLDRAIDITWLVARSLDEWSDLVARKEKETNE